MGQAVDAKMLVKSLHANGEGIKDEEIAVRVAKTG